MSPALASDLRGLLGADSSVVADDAGTLGAHAGDKWFASHPPEVVVFARGTEDVSRLLRFCTERRVPVTARGSGYGYVGGCVPVRGGVALSLARLNRILEIDERDFVAVVQPGVITGELQAAVRERGLMYPPDPASLKNSSIGGNIATNAGGPRCLKYGVTRQYILGLEVVLADGEIVRCGGRTHKNKTGFDLVGLFVGSEGLLGIVTEATLKLLPLPPSRAAFSCGLANMAVAASAVQTIFAAGWLPAAVEIADRYTLDAARAMVGEHQVPPGEAHLLVELDGRDTALRHEINELRTLLVDACAIAPQTALGEDCERLWELRRLFSESLRATGLIKLNEDIAVPRGRLVDLMEFATGLQTRLGIPVACFGHAGDGNIHVNLMAANYHEDAAMRGRVDQALDELFRQVLAWGGAITGEHGIGLAKLRWWPDALSDANRALHARLKSVLDPHGILNPGKFLVQAGGKRGSQRE